MTSWATSAVGSVTGRGKKSKDKDTFAALNDGDDDEDEVGNRGILRRSNSSQSNNSRKRKSKESLTPSPKTAFRILKPQSLKDTKIVRALEDFNGSVDELSFKTGDEIIVVSEVIEGWLMGELEGRKGLFPTSATEVVATVPSKLISSRSGRTISDRSSLSDDESTKQPVAQETDIVSELEDDYIMNAQHLSTDPGPFFGQYAHSDDAASVTDEDDGQQRSSLNQWKSSSTPTVLPSLDPQQSQASRGGVEPNASASGKKAPPPPPPRRLTSGLQGPSPPIPPRRPVHNQSSNALTISAMAASITRHASPFESPKD
jgi:hypothetical protein